MKKLILILLASVLLTPLHAQCDSAISVCPNAFDYLIKQEVLAKKYYMETLKLGAQLSVLKFELGEADSLQKTTSGLLAVSNEKGGLKQKSLDIQLLKVKKLDKQVKWLKFGCVAIGITGVVTTIYVAVKK